MSSLDSPVSQRAFDVLDDNFRTDVVTHRLLQKQGLPLNTVKNRIRRGWDEDRIMNTPRRPYPEITNACH